MPRIKGQPFSKYLKTSLAIVVIRDGTL